MNKSKVIAIIQARMASSRMPGKVMKKIAGKTIIEIILERLKACRQIDDIVLATSINQKDDVLAKHGQSVGLNIYRGSEDNVLSRLLETAKKHKADAFVRLTADCPLVDPAIVDELVKIYRENPRKYDYLCDYFHYTFPVGFELDVIPTKVFKELDKKLTGIQARERFVFYVHEHPEDFKIYNLKCPEDFSRIRLTLDYEEDLILIKKIYEALSANGRIFNFRDIINFLGKNPELLEINKNRMDESEISRKAEGACHDFFET